MSTGRFGGPVLVLLLMLPVASPAAPASAPPRPGSLAQGLSRDEAVALALEHNPALRAARAQVDAAAGRARQAKQWSNPELEVSAEEWPISGPRGFSDAKQTVGIAQVFPFPGKKSLDRQIGRAGVTLNAAAFDLRRLELIRDVTAAFWGVLAAERLVGVAEELVALTDASATIARKRVDAGAATYQEQLRAEIQREQARLELSGFRRDAVSARRAFATLLGRPELHEVPLAGSMTETPVARLLELQPADWLPAHPSAHAARAALDRARLAERRARRQPYPDVKAGVAGGRLGETDESIVELRFSVPLPLLDRSKGGRQEAQAEVDAAEAELLAIEQKLVADWHRARERYRTALSQVADYRERMVPKSDEALRLVRIGFEQGKFGFIDLLDTQRTTAEVRLAYQNKLLELNLAQAELEALMPSPLAPSATRNVP